MYKEDYISNRFILLIFTLIIFSSCGERNIDQNLRDSKFPSDEPYNDSEYVFSCDDPEGGGNGTNQLNNIPLPEVAVGNLNTSDFSHRRVVDLYFKNICIKNTELNHCKYRCMRPSYEGGFYIPRVQVALNSSQEVNLSENTIFDLKLKSKCILKENGFCTSYNLSIEFREKLRNKKFEKIALISNTGKFSFKFNVEEGATQTSGQGSIWSNGTESEFFVTEDDSASELLYFGLDKTDLNLNRYFYLNYSSLVSLGFQFSPFLNVTSHTQVENNHIEVSGTLFNIFDQSGKVVTVDIYSESL